MSRNFGRGAAALALVLSVVACGGGSASTDEPSDEETSDSTPIETVEPTFQPMSAGTLTVCAAEGSPPFTSRDSSGDWAGFDIDLVSAVATRYGLALEVSAQPADGIWLAPAAGTCDLAAAGVTIDEERSENALFSDSYLGAAQSLLVRTADMEKYFDLETLAGRTVAVLKGSAGEAYATENGEGTTLEAFDSAGAMYSALDAGKVDAVLHDFVHVAAQAKAQAGKTTVSGSFSTGLAYGLAVAKDNVDLQSALNESINEFRATGTYEEIHVSYFGDANSIE